MGRDLLKYPNPTTYQFGVFQNRTSDINVSPNHLFTVSFSLHDLCIFLSLRLVASSLDNAREITDYLELANH